MGMEADGAIGASWCKFIKKLSEIAHERMKHNKASFRLFWSTRIGMCLANEGAKAWVKRMRKLTSHFNSNNAALEHHDIDILPELGINEILVADTAIYSH